MQISNKFCWLSFTLLWLAGCSQVPESVREEVTEGAKTSVVEDVAKEKVAKPNESKSEPPVAKKDHEVKAPAVKDDKTKDDKTKVVTLPVVEKPTGNSVKEEQPKKITTPVVTATSPITVTKVENPKQGNQSAPGVAGTTEKPVVKDKPIAVNTPIKSNDQSTIIGNKTSTPVTVVKIPSLEEIIKRANDYYDKKDFVNAVVWYQQAADRRVIKAQYRLGEMYYNGEGVSRNFVQAEKWYRQAAEQGEAQAQYRLGKLYYAVEDYSQAILWFIKAAQQGVPEAQKMLGNIYYQGKGVSPQLKEAFYWSLKAAEQGQADAQNNVALMYFKGEGVEQDYIRSYQWVSLAVAQGNPEAIKARDFFVSKISPAQLMEGERLANEWMATHPSKK